MTILTRISRLFKADIHGILDSLEEPEIILKQAVRDMQDEIGKATANIDALTRQQDRLQEKHLAVTTTLQELQQQLHFCLAENNDVLAKAVIKKKLLAEGSLNELARQTKAVSEEKQLKIRETDERKEKLQAIRDKLALFTEQPAQGHASTVSGLTPPITQDDIELAFLYEKQRYTEAAFKGDKP
jgi:phage shock protein A